MISPGASGSVAVDAPAVQLPRGSPNGRCGGSAAPAAGSTVRAGSAPRVRGANSACRGAATRTSPRYSGRTCRRWSACRGSISRFPRAGGSCPKRAARRCCSGGGAPCARVPPPRPAPRLRAPRRHGCPRRPRRAPCGAPRAARGGRTPPPRHGAPPPRESRDRIRDRGTWLHQRFTAARSFAERDRGLRSSSAAEGVTALRVTGSKGTCGRP